MAFVRPLFPSRVTLIKMTVLRFLSVLSFFFSLWGSDCLPAWLVGGGGGRGEGRGRLSEWFPTQEDYGFEITRPSLPLLPSPSPSPYLSLFLLRLHICMPSQLRRGRAAAAAARRDVWPLGGITYPSPPSSGKRRSTTLARNYPSKVGPSSSLPPHATIHMSAHAAA